MFPLQSRAHPTMRAGDLGVWSRPPLLVIGDLVVAHLLLTLGEVSQKHLLDAHVQAVWEARRTHRKQTALLQPLREPRGIRLIVLPSNRTTPRCRANVNRRISEHIQHEALLS